MDKAFSPDLHIKLIKAVAQECFFTTMLVKGGAALRLAYGSERETEDIDFDSSKKFNLTHKIVSAGKKIGLDVDVDIKRNTDTGQKYIAQYSNSEFSGTLKVEVSFREGELPDGRIFDGIKFQGIEKIIEAKHRLVVFGGRTKFRDLVDYAFLLKNYKNEFTPTQISEASVYFFEINSVASRYQPANEKNEDLDGVLLDISESFSLSSPNGLQTSNSNIAITN
jgi:hypothetical protein